MGEPSFVLDKVFEVHNRHEIRVGILVLDVVYWVNAPQVEIISLEKAALIYNGIDICDGKIITSELPRCLTEMKVMIAYRRQ